MLKEILLPDLGEGISSADVSEVLVSPGDSVSVDDIILVLESEKASMEIPSEDKGIIGPEIRLVILVGFLGSFTTFSTFAFDNKSLVSNGQIGYFIINIFLNNLLGIFFIYLGFKISKLV